MPQTRDKEATRARILEAAFAEFHRAGFQSADLDAVADTAGVTRGTLYYHFGSKEGLARHVVEEVAMRAWAGPVPAALATTDDPITVLSDAVVERPVSAGDRALLGCPINNLTQEMAVQSEEIRQALEHLYVTFEGQIADALRRGQERGTVRGDIDPLKVALFYIAAGQGMMGLTKAHQDLEMPRLIGEVMIDYLEGLRPQGR